MKLSEAIARMLAWNDELARDHFHRKHPGMRCRNSHPVNHDVTCAKWERDRTASIDQLVPELVEAMELYASCPEHSGIPERIINGGEYIGLGTTARIVLTKLSKAVGAE